MTQTQYPVKFALWSKHSSVWDFD